MDCDFCGKKPTFGHNVSHSKRRTNRAWLPNVQRTTVAIGGRKMRLHLCTRCMRTLAKI